MSAILKSEPAFTTLYSLFEQAGIKDPPANAANIVMSVTPMPHQVEGLRRALLDVKFGLYDEPGAGKTLPAQAFALCNALYGNRVVVVMPPTLLDQFTESLHQTFLYFDKYVKYHRIKHTVNKRMELISEWDRNNTWPDILAVSYQMFVKLFYAPAAGLQLLKQSKRNTGFDLDEEKLASLKEKSKLGTIEEEDSAWLEKALSVARQRKRVSSLSTEVEYTKIIKKAGYNVAILDEAHNIRRITSLQHKAIHHFLFGDKDEERSVLLMTGTPAFNTLLDTYGLTKMVSPNTYQNFQAFERYHASYVTQMVMVKDKRGILKERPVRKLIGFNNVQFLTKAMYRHARRIRKEDVFSLEKPILTEVPVRLESAHARLYEKLVRERVLQVDGKMIDAIQAQSLRMKCLRLVTTPEEFTEEKNIENNVKATLKELVDSLGVHYNPMGDGTNEKVVVFAHFKSSIVAIAELLKEYNPVTMYSDTKNQNESRKKFLNDPECRVMVANPVSGGVGLNLQSVCRYIIFAEPTSVPGLFKQACERVHRVGQTKVVSIWLLKALGTISPKLTESMLKKESEIVKAMMDKESILKELLGGA